MLNVNVCKGSILARLQDRRMNMETDREGMSRLLIIDDDRELFVLLAERMQSEGFQLEAAHDGRNGLELATTGNYSLVILDIMMPRLGGMDVLRLLRAKSSVPVLMLTAKGDDIDRILGLELGADDYLPKPFNPRELIARIRAILRRVEERGQTPSRVDADDIAIDVERARLAFRGSRWLSLQSNLQSSKCSFVMWAVCSRGSS
jgi:DNA-binding response OmpR family regulator